VVSLLLGGHVDAIVDLPASLASPARAGSVRLLASLSPLRDPARPARSDHTPSACTRD